MSTHHNPSKSLTSLLNLNPHPTDISTQRKKYLENKRNSQSFLSLEQRKQRFFSDHEKLRFSPKYKNPFQKSIYKKLNQQNFTGILLETQRFKDDLTLRSRSHGAARSRSSMMAKINLVRNNNEKEKGSNIDDNYTINESQSNDETEANYTDIKFSNDFLNRKKSFNDEEKKNLGKFYGKSIRPFMNMNTEQIIINSKRQSPKIDHNASKLINSPQNSIINDSILKGKRIIDYPKKIDHFYNTTMACHIFESSLKEKERNRLSIFLTNDWINKVLLDRKVEDVKNSEFIQPLSERQKIQRQMEEKKKIRKDFKSEILKTKKHYHFLIPQKSLEKLRKTILLPNKIENQLESDGMHEVKAYGDRDRDFHEEMEILKNMKKNEKNKKFVYKRIKKFKLEEIRASVLDYVSFLKDLEEMHEKNANFKDCIPDKPYHNVGSYLFLKLIKRNKLGDVKKMLEENSFLIYEFDEVFEKLNFTLLFILIFRAFAYSSSYSLQI